MTKSDWYCCPALAMLAAAGTHLSQEGKEVATVLAASVCSWKN